MRMAEGGAMTERAPKEKRETLAVSVRLPADLVRTIEEIAHERYTSVTALVGQGLKWIVDMDRVLKSPEFITIALSLDRDGVFDKVLTNAKAMEEAKKAAKATAPEPPTRTPREDLFSVPEDEESQS
jgi:hypothetical protein